MNARRYLALLLAAFLITPAYAQTIRGVVLDSATREPLRFVTVRVAATKKAAVTTTGGRFVLRGMPADSVTLHCSLVGYASSTVRAYGADSAVVVLLAERPFRSAEVVVTAEDPAVRIMRKVLARKRQQNDTLQRYTYMLYTKFIAITDTITASRSSGRGDTTVFSILESYSKGYVRRPSDFFNEILQRRQTANIPPQANFVSFGTNLNAYDNVITILGEQIPTPFHEDALDFYDYELKSSEEDDVVQIDVRPHGIARKAFVGSIFIDQRTSAPVEVRLAPNRAVNLPFDASLSYRQTFTIDDGAVVPQAMVLRSSLQADILFIFSPRLDVTIETFCYDYAINASFDDDVFEQRRVEINPSAASFDSTFWRVNEKIPLRADEERAYEEIRLSIENPDSLMTTSFFDRYLGPVTRTIAKLGQRPFTGFDDVIRYNRVHGLYVGLGLRFRPDTSIELRSIGGYGIADDRGYGSIGATYFFGPRQTWSVDVNVHSALARRDNPYTVRTPLISLTSALFGNDYGDYYYANGWEAGVKVGSGQLQFIRNDEWERPTTMRFYVRSEHQTSAVFHDTWSLFPPSQPRRELPPIIDGVMRTIGFDVNVNYNPWRTISRTGCTVNAEFSDPSLLASEFSFRRIQTSIWLRTRTLPLWTLDISVSGGIAEGNVPPQRYFSLESSVSGIAAQGALRGMRVKEFYGDRYAVVSIAHNFGEVIPGLLRIPDVASLGIEFILNAAVGWTTFATAPAPTYAYRSTQMTADHLYYETGLGINRILLFFRLDVTARLSQVDVPRFFVTLGAATF